MKVLKRAYFRTTPKTTQFWGPKNGRFFRTAKNGLIFGPKKEALFSAQKKRPKNGRFLGLEKAAILDTEDTRFFIILYKNTINIYRILLLKPHENHQISYNFIVL
jgi:hypothetical protein